MEQHSHSGLERTVLKVGPLPNAIWNPTDTTTGKLTRVVKEIQAHMRLRSSGDRHEIRQQYVPSLWAQMVKKLEDSGKDAVPDVIDLMDSYFLTKEDWDGILELGVGPMDMEKVKLESQTKATFTRLYVLYSQPKLQRANISTATMHNPTLCLS